MRQRIDLSVTFIYEATGFDELSIIFSEERLDGYLSHAKCNNSKTNALIAYSWNIELSQSLYPALQILEITLRNSLHQALSTSFSTEYWFVRPYEQAIADVRSTSW
jgi:hypothetical protein